MKQAFEGIYNNGKVILNEKVLIKGKQKVLVVFLDDKKEKAERKNRLLCTFGSWEDDKDSQQIINDIYSSRASRKEDIIL